MSATSRPRPSSRPPHTYTVRHANGAVMVTVQTSYWANDQYRPLPLVAVAHGCEHDRQPKLSSRSHAAFLLQMGRGAGMQIERAPR